MAVVSAVVCATVSAVAGAAVRAVVRAVERAVVLLNTPAGNTALGQLIQHPRTLEPKP